MAKYIVEPMGFKGVCSSALENGIYNIKDKQKFALFIKKIQSHDFARIIVTHGDIIESNAKQIFASLTERFLKYV